LDISIIIVNYRGWKALDECLESIDSIVSKTFSFETIIVDNCSNDGQFSVFKQKYPKFTFIQNSGNNGFSNGCNFGASIAKGNHFLFLNPDTKITLDALETLLKTAVSHTEIGILSCLQINENNVFYNQNNLFPALGRFFGISRSLFKKLNKVKLEKRFNNNNDLFYPDWVTGAVVFISREWFNKINGWNEDYWLYFEDVDLCCRIRKNGWKIKYTPVAKVVHIGGRSAQSNVTKAFIEYRMSQLYFYKKYHGTLNLQILKIYLLLKLLYNTNIYFWRFVFKKEKKKEAMEDINFMGRLFGMVLRYS